MANAIFLTNPELTTENVTVVATGTTLGQRSNPATAAAGNSGQMSVETIGSPGDTAPRIVDISGSEQLSFYYPYNAAGQKLYSTLTPSTLGTLTLANQPNGGTMVAARDREYLIVEEEASPKVIRAYVWNGSMWVLKASHTTDTDSRNNLSCCVGVNGRMVFIAEQNNTLDQINFYIFDTETNTIGEIGQGVATDAGGTRSVVMAYDGTTFVVLISTGTGVLHYTGPDLGSLSRARSNLSTLFQQQAITQVFGATWSISGTSLDLPAIAHNSYYGFVAAFRVNAGASSTLRVARSDDGVRWEELKDIFGNVAQPTVTSRFANAKTMGIALGRVRIHLFRSVGATEDTTSPTGIKMHFFSGRTWVAETSVDGGAAVLSNATISANTWRGGVFFGWAQSATVAIVRATQRLTISVDGARELIMGRRNYIDGPMDDTQTALAIVPHGGVFAGDSFTISPYYDYAPENMIKAPLGETYRTADGGAPNVVLDIQAGRRLVGDSFALWGTNVPALTFQMNATDSWGAPSVALSLSAVKYTLTVASADDARVTLTTGTLTKGELAIRKTWAQLSTGIFRIVDNGRSPSGADWIVVDGNPGSPSTAAGGAIIFGDRMALFPGAEYSYEFGRIVYPTALSVPDDYCEIAGFKLGSKLQTTRNYAAPLAVPVDQPQITNVLRGGRIVSQPSNSMQRRTYPMEFQLYREPEISAWEAFQARTRGAVEQVLFWPKGEAEPNNFLVGHVESVELRRVEKLVWNAAVKFVEDVA